MPPSKGQINRSSKLIEIAYVRAELNLVPNRNNNNDCNTKVIMLDLHCTYISYLNFVSQIKKENKEIENYITRELFS